MLGRGACRTAAALETNAEAQLFLPNQAAMLSRAAVHDHEAAGELRGNQEFETGAATRNIDDLAIDGGRLRVENELAGLRDETARPDTRVTAVLYFASFSHDIANKPSYRKPVKAGLTRHGRACHHKSAVADL